MFERPRSGERAVLVHVDIGVAPDADEFREFRELAVSAGAHPVAMITGSRKTADPRLYIGRGKAEEIRFVVAEEKVELVIFNHPGAKSGTPVRMQGGGQERPYP